DPIRPYEPLTSENAALVLVDLCVPKIGFGYTRAQWLDSVDDDLADEIAREVAEEAGRKAGWETAKKNGREAYEEASFELMSGCCARIGHVRVLHVGHL